MPTDSQPEGRDLRAEPSESDKMAARVELIENAGLWRSREDFGDDTEKEAALARFHAQAREAGRRERDAQTVAWLREQVRKMVAEAVTRNECDDQAAWACAASEAIWRAIERGDHLRRGE